MRNIHFLKNGRISIEFKFFLNHIVFFTHCSFLRLTRINALQQNDTVNGVTNEKSCDKRTACSTKHRTKSRDVRFLYR